MKYLIIFFFSLLFSFEVEFNDITKIQLFPNKKVILLETKTPLNINYSPKIYTSQGIVLLNYEQADEFVRNDLYFNGKIKDIKISLLNMDKVRYKIIQRIKKNYPKCKIKKIIFNNFPSQEFYLKPIILKINSKIILDCH